MRVPVASGRGYTTLWPMKGPALLLALLLAAGFAPASPGAEVESWRLCACQGEHYRQGRRHVPEEALPGVPSRKYAPDRIIDVHHLALDLTPDFERRSIRATATLTFAPIAEAVRQIRLDAVDLRIERIESTAPLESHSVEAKALLLLFEKPIPPGEEHTVTIHYSAEPRDGLFFRTPESGYAPGDTHLWTQGEPQRHRHWFPSHDYPNERFSTEVICRVPEGMTVLSNGRLLSRESGEDGLVAFHWLQEIPHVNYLVSVVAGYLEGVHDEYREIPIGFYTPPSEFEQAANSFADTKAILRFFEREIGVPYPWAKYYNVCVFGFPYGGMENTSVTTLTARTLFTDATENLHTTRHLDAHEIAHQWFGNLVTCKDWTHLWLNEGFATYYTELYEAHKLGPDHLKYRMDRNARRVFRAKDDKPIAWRDYKEPWEQFDYRAYPKGAWVLHMLRSQLGPDLFRACVRDYLETHRGEVAVTEDLNSAFEEVSGRSFDRFFDQWVYHGGHPKLRVRYAWEANRKQVRLTVSQTQETSERVLLFEFPLPVRFHLPGGKVANFEVRVTQQREDFWFALAEEPEAVRVDPDFTVLAEVDVELPNPLVEAQAALEEDVIGRLFAVRMLGEREDNRARELLTERLREDPFFGVRMEAAEILGDRQTREALRILTDSLEQKDARVRQAVVKAIGRFYTAEARAELERIVGGEPNPGIVATALAAIGKYPGETIRDTLLAALERPSYRHRIAVAAIAAMRKQADSSYVASLREHLAEHTSRFTMRDFGKALETLAELGTEAEPQRRDEILQDLGEFLHDPRRQIAVAAVRALGHLEDSRALALLEPLQGVKSGPGREKAEAARKSIERIRGKRTQSRELNELRSTVLDLEEQVRELRESVETMRQKPERPTP